MSQENDNTHSILSSDSDSSCDSFARADLYREIIRPPVPGDQLAYEVKFDKPQFSIVNGYLSIVPRCYEYNLCNSVSLLEGDTVVIKITVPKQILGCKNGYEFPVGVPLVNLVGSIKFEADNANFTVLLSDASIAPNGIVVTDEIGWVTFTLTYVVQQDLDNLCSLCYSIGFESIKLLSLYHACGCKRSNCNSCKKSKKCRRPFESISLESETSLTITSVAPTTLLP